MQAVTMTLALDAALSLGAPLPTFRLPEPLTGRFLGPEDYADASAVLVAFLSNRCPEVRRIAAAFAGLGLDFAGSGLRILAVNSADGDDAPEESPAAVAAEALRHGYVFPYLIDQTQGVAQAFGADLTPDFYLFGADRRLAYHGRFDETRYGGARAAHGADLRRAVQRTLNGQTPAAHQAASEGCRIRWREAGPAV